MVEGLTEEQQAEINRKADELMANIRFNPHHKLRGAKVFCVSCGAGTRAPLRKWHNVYICSECWKIMKIVGEEKFKENLYEQNKN